MPVSYVYDIGKPVDLKLIKKKMPYFESIRGDENFLYTKIDSLNFILFKDGKLRIVHEEGSIELLNKALPAASVKLGALIADIEKKLNLKINPNIIITGGKLEQTPPTISRPSGELVGIAIIREMGLATEAILSEYHRERLATQAGENVGRKIGNVKGKKELEKGLVGYIKEQGLGIPELVEPKEEKGKKPYSIIRLYESAFSYALPPSGKPACHFVRGMIRGAFCSYLGQENVSVVESKCWGKGDVFCEFKVYLLTM